MGRLGLDHGTARGSVLATVGICYAMVGEFRSLCLLLLVLCCAALWDGCDGGGICWVEKGEGGREYKGVGEWREG